MKNHEHKKFKLAQVRELKKMLNGKVFLPGTAEYEKSRISWNLLADQYPAIIIEAASAKDILCSVKFAEDIQLKVAVQATGHGTLFQCDGQILLKTSLMKGIRMDSVKRTIHLEAGVVWGEVIKLTQSEGLAPLSGTAPSVGVVGFTLNGGFSWLTRKFGLASDSLLAVEMVTMDGKFLTVSLDSDAELFRALAGGGPQFGIVTAIEVKLYPVDQVFSGRFYFPVTRASEVIEGYRKWTLALPNEVTTVLKLEFLPQDPEIAVEFQGKPGLVIQGCLHGDVGRSHLLFSSLTNLEPLLIREGTMSFVDLPKFSGEPINPLKLYVHSVSFEEFSEELGNQISSLIDRLPKDQPMIMEFRHIGSDVLKKYHGFSSFSHRQTVAVLNLIFGLKPNENNIDGKAKAASFIEGLAKFSSGKTLSNFLYHGNDKDRVKSAYDDETLERLLDLKKRFDPKETLLSNFSIK